MLSIDSTYLQTSYTTVACYPQPIYTKLYKSTMAASKNSCGQVILHMKN